MDNLTHSLAGAVLGQMGLKKKTGLAMPALILGANLPDIDAISLLWLEGKESLGFRRGITHGPLGVIILPFFLSALLWSWDRWQDRRGKRPESRAPVSFKWLYILGAFACLTHPLMDWLNVYGVRFLYPFDKSWYYGDTLFIIDVWLWALLGFAVWLSLRLEKKGGDGKKPARIAVTVSLAYIALNWMISSTAEDKASGQPAIASPLPGASWQREVIEPYRVDQWLIDGKPVGKCALEPAVAGAQGNSQAEGFLTWSRVPFAQRAEDGSVILYDARFYDPRARDRFSIALPDVKCQPLE